MIGTPFSKFAKHPIADESTSPLYGHPARVHPAPSQHPRRTFFDQRTPFAQKEDAA